MDGADGIGQSRASAGSFAPLRSAQNDKIIVILRSVATKDFALARSPYRTHPSGVAASLPVARAKRAGRARAARPYGVEPRPFMLQQQVGGNRLAGQRLYARSAS